VPTPAEAIWSELVSLRFVEQAHNALILGPVGVCKTFLATALGHIACRRKISVHFERADKLHKRLKSARLDGSYDQEIRKLIGVELLLLDDLCLQALDAIETVDLFELVIERHHRASTIVTSDREPSEWLAMMADPLLAQSTVDRLKSAAWELVIEGNSYRPREKPRLDNPPTTAVPDPAQLAAPNPAIQHRGTHHLTYRQHQAIITSAGTRQRTPSGPKLLATGWSDRAGK
jgi:DNA replication protein DnaC